MHADADDPLTDAMLHQGHALRALARSILRGADGADDAVQDAAVAALARATPPRDPFAWFACVVRNFALRKRRDAARRQRLDAVLASSTASGAEREPADLDEHERLARAVRALPEPWRRAIVLRFWHDLPPRAIAQQLELPIATVKTHLQRGLAALRERLRADHGGRDAWLGALVPLAHPRLRPGAAAAAPLATAATTLLVMKLHHALVLAAAAVLLTLGVWQPWRPADARGPGTPTADAAAPVAATIVRPQAGDHEPVGAKANVSAASTGPAARTAAAPAQRTCTVVGRIVATGDVPVAGARLRLENLVEWPQAPNVGAATTDDGTFSVAVPRPHDWIPYRLALADAPGWATREVEIGQDLQRSIADDRLDLGTLRLERGVAVSGRVLEADGSPLRTRARLLAWDPGRTGSWTAMHDGRTVGIVDAGGTFALDERLSANPGAMSILAAVSASGVGWANFAFAAGQQQLDPIEIRLLPGGGADVRVVDPDGKPIAGAHVHASPYFKPIGLAPMWEPSRGGSTPALPELEALFARRTDADGWARFTNLPRGDAPRVRDANADHPRKPAMLMTAAHTGFVTNTAAVDPIADGAATVTITIAPKRRVVFHGVVATKDGARLPGVTVSANGPEVSASTDAEGRYELAPHTYESDQGYFVIEGGDVPRHHLLAPIPKTGERVAQDFVVEVRAPVTGRVVDEAGVPVAGAELHLGIPNGVHYHSTPERTGADGVFAFPDATASHTNLWIAPPEPRTAWRIEPSRALARRDGETIVLQRLDGPLVDLTLAIVDGRDGAAVSPTEVRLWRLFGSTLDLRHAHVQPTLALGAATMPQLPPGVYRAVVRAGDGLRAEREFTLPTAPATHTERLEMWPALSVTCIVDASALSADDLAARRGGLVLLDGPDEQSQAYDLAGKRMNLTPNTGLFRFGGDMAFRLVGVTPNVARRLRVLGDDLFGETWFTATPGADAHVTLRLARAGRITFVAPAAWPAGTIEVDVRDGDAWRPAASWQHGGPDTDPCEATPLQRPAGDTAWRLRLFPADGAPVLERTGTTTVAAGQSTPVTLAQ